MVYLLVFCTVIGMTAAQLLLKRGMIAVGEAPHTIHELANFFIRACINPYVITAIIITAATAVVWIYTVSKAQISFIYPFMSLSYVLVALFSLLLFREDVTITRWLGVAVICIGVFIVARS